MLQGGPVPAGAWARAGAARHEVAEQQGGVDDGVEAVVVLGVDAVGAVEEGGALHARAPLDAAGGGSA